MSRFAAISLALLSPAIMAGAVAAEGKPVQVTLPSGAVAVWQETRHDNSGGLGLTYRFRFVMADLAARVPSTSGPASDIEPADETGRGPIDIDTESGEVSGDDPAPPQSDVISDPAAEPEADPGIDEAAEQEADAMIDSPALPAAPGVLAQDPVHDDIVWLCENWALPRIASPGPRPSQIIISLASKETAFGAYDPAAVQVFEAFRLPPDRDACEWEPW